MVTERKEQNIAGDKDTGTEGKVTYHSRGGNIIDKRADYS